MYLKYGRKDETNEIFAVVLGNTEITLIAVKPPVPGSNPDTGFPEM